MITFPNILVGNQSEEELICLWPRVGRARTLRCRAKAASRRIRQVRRKTARGDAGGGKAVSVSSARSSSHFPQLLISRLHHMTFVSQLPISFSSQCQAISLASSFSPINPSFCPLLASYFHLSASLPVFTVNGSFAANRSLHVNQSEAGKAPQWHLVVRFITTLKECVFFLRLPFRDMEAFRPKTGGSGKNKTDKWLWLHRLAVVFFIYI